MSSSPVTEMETTPETTFVCEAECETYSDECPFCMVERLACDAVPSSSATESDALHAALTDKLAGGGFDPELKERPGSIGITYQGPNRRRRKPQWVAQFWNSRLGFPFPVTVGTCPTKEAAAEAYDVACLAMGLPARNFPDRVHAEGTIASVRAHLEACRKPA